MSVSGGPGGGNDCHYARVRMSDKLSGLTFIQFIDILDDLEKDGPGGAALLGHVLLKCRRIIQ